MRGTATQMQRLTIRMQRGPLPLVRWAYRLLLLFAVIANTFSGDLLMTRAAPLVTTYTSYCTDHTNPVPKHCASGQPCATTSATSTTEPCSDQGYCKTYPNDCISTNPSDDSTPHCRIYPKDTDCTGPNSDCGLSSPNHTQPWCSTSTADGFCVYHTGDPGDTCGTSNSTDVPPRSGNPCTVSGTTVTDASPIPCYYDGPCNDTIPVVDSQTLGSDTQGSFCQVSAANPPPTTPTTRSGSPCTVSGTTVTDASPIPCYYPATTCNDTIPAVDSQTLGSDTQGSFCQVSAANPALNPPTTRSGSLCTVSGTTVTDASPIPCYYPATTCNDTIPAVDSQTLGSDTQGSFCQVSASNTGPSPTSNGVNVPAPTAATTCPAGTQPKTAGSNTQCTGSGNSTINPICGSGSVYDDSSGTAQCYSNPPAYYVDNSGNCTTSTATGGAGNSYTCPYGTTGGKVVCTITTGINPEEDCIVSNNTGNIGNYKCYGLGANNFIPTSCDYYGTDTTGKKTGSANCQPGGSGYSCQITICVTIDGSTFTSSAFNNTCRAEASDTSTITVQIDQTCTAPSNGLPLNCTYGNAATTAKSYYVNLVCIGSLTCDITSPLAGNGGVGGFTIHENCPNSDPTAGSNSCTFSVSGTDTSWSGTCYPHDSGNGGYANGHCQLNDNNGNGIGVVGCTSATSCSITDDAGNTRTVTCSGTFCTSPTPTCPSFRFYKIGNRSQSSSILCTGDLAFLPLGISGVNTMYTLQYPLSQDELLYTLNKLGVGSQLWKTDPTNKNLAPMFEL